MTLQNDIPSVRKGDWTRLKITIDKLRHIALGAGASPTFAGLTLTGLTASTLIGANASKALESITVGTGLDYTRPNLTLSHLGIEALTDPGADKILFWDDTASACKWLGMGNSVAITDVTLDTIQDIRTTATPLFGGLIIANGGYIGSVGDENAIQIAVSGEVTFTDVVTGILPTAGAHLATKEYVDLAIGASADFFLSDNDDGSIADYHILYETDTGEASSTLVTDPMVENDDQLMFSYITASGVPGVEFLRAGVYILHTHMSRGTGDKPTTFYWTLSKYTIGDVETVILTSEESSTIPDSTISFITHATLAADTAILDTDRLVLKLYANVGAAGGNSEVTIHMEGTHDCHLTNQLPSSIWQNQGDVLDDLNITGVNTFTGDPVNDFLVGTAAGTLAWQYGATARTSMGIGTGDSPTFSNLTLGATGAGELTCGSINKAANTLTLEIAGTPVISVLDSHVNIDGTLYARTGSVNVGVSDTTAGQWVCYGGASGAYGGRSYFHTNADADDVIDFYHVRVEDDDLHIGDDVNGNIITIAGTAGNVTIATTLGVTGAITAANYTAVNLLTACATNAGALDFSAAGKTLTVEDDAIVSQDYSSDASPQFTGIELGHVSDTTITRVSAGVIAVEGVTVMLVGGAPTAHLHDGDTLEHDAVNSSAGAFSFTTAGIVTFSNAITMSIGMDLTIPGNIIFNVDNSYIGYTDAKLALNGTAGSATLTGSLSGTSTAAFEGASVTVGKASTTTGTIVLHDSGSANTITLTVPNALAGSLTFTLPPTDGANTEVLQTDGNGVLTWVANAGVGNHAMLDGSVHTDSVADTISRGSLIYGNATPKWDELDISTGFLRGDGTDCAWLSYANSLAAMSGVAGAAFSFNDQNITNVGSIALDSIISDGAAAALTITATAGQAVTVENVSFDGGVVSGMGTLGCDAITSTATGIFEGASVTIGKASTTTGTLVLHDSGSANTITLTVPNALAGSLSFTLPPTDGDNTEVLQTNGSGVLTWVANGGGTTIKSNWGYVPGDGDTSCQEAVTFDAAFTGIPDIVVNCLGYKDDTPSNRGDVSVHNDYVCTAQDPSTTGFTLVATDTAGNNISAGGGFSSDLCTGGTALENEHLGVNVAARTFDDTDDTAWISNAPSSGDYVGYDFGSGNDKHIRKITIEQSTVALGTDYVCTSVSVDYSDNGADWTPLQTLTPALNTTQQDFELNESAAHRYWRIRALQNVDGGPTFEWAVDEIQMMNIPSARNIVYSWMAKEPGSD